MKPGSSLHASDGNQDRQKGHDHCVGDDQDDDQDKEIPIRADSQQEGDEEQDVEHCSCKASQQTYTSYHQSIDHDDAHQIVVNSDGGGEASGRPRGRLPLDPIQPF